MRKAALWLAVFIGISVWMSCGGRQDEEADKAALACYNLLIEGRYEDYVSAIAYSDSMTEEQTLLGRQTPDNTPA